MKDNRLLAEYLGIELDCNGIVKNHDPLATYRECSIWNPHEDWNQLMMVVEKIESESEWIDVGITRNHCLIDEGERTIVPVNWQIKSKIEAVYNACVEYIKQKK